MYQCSIDHNIILDAYSKNTNIKQIARDYKGQITENTIKQILSMHGILSWMTNPVPENIQNEIVELYAAHTPIQEIHNQLHLSKQTIGAILKSKNIIRKRTSKYIFDENYFEKIDSEHKAYWLGFLYADGYVNLKKIRFEFGLIDKDILEKFANDIGISKDKIKERQTKCNNKYFKSYRLTLESKKLVQDLINAGCMERKSFILKFPSFDIVPRNLMQHFIRGFYDGDGCHKAKSKTKCFIGTVSILDGIRKILREDTKIKGKMNITKSRNIYYLRFGISDTNILNEYMYNNCTIYLERKK